ncbi:MAG: phosphodiester glycosidase family protein [Clostridia bacterium]|nr:phosphodiester glycosidase family protein [Clostridia bacterium]
MINNHIRMAFGALLTAAMLARLPLSALSYTGLGEVITIKRDTVGGGLYYSKLESVTEEGKPQQSYIFEYDFRAGGTLPIVRFGNTVYGKDRLGSLVTTAGNEGKTVFGAINGDFYSMQTGVPMGVMIDGGKLITTDDAKYALGFLSDGSAIIGKPEISMTVTNLTSGGEAKKIDHLNKFPTIWGVYMVTGDFASTTLSATESLELVIELDGDITASGSVEGEIKDIITDKYNIEIPEGCAVITVSESCESYSLFTDFKKGDRIRIDTKCAEIWDRIVTAVGGGDMILEAGVMPEGIIDEDHEKTVNPRTAVGLKPDGNVVFFAVDGRTSASRGLKIEDLSAVMAELGCTYALNLDGGGSTTVMVKPSGSADTAYVNTPSDGSYRSISNGILFLSANESDGKPAALKVTPNTPYILRGSTITFTAEALDSSYMPVDVNFAPDSLVTAFAEEYPEDIGSVSSCSFTAGLTGGEYRLKVTNGDISGDVSVIVKDKLDELTVTPEATQIKPGTLLTLDIEAISGGKSLHCDAGSFYYTLNGTHDVPDPGAYPDAMIICDLGYLDKNGNFQAFGGEYEGEVEIGVWFDEFVRYVNVTVSDKSHVISDFEDDAAIDGFELTTPSGDAHIVPASHGYKSERGLEVGFTYNTEAQSKVMELKLREEVPMSSDAESIKLWIYGYTTGVLSASVRDEDGNVYDLSYTVTKDYSKQLGWRELTAEIPESLKSGTLHLASLLTVNDSGSSQRNYVIDDALIYYGKAAEPALTGLDEHWAGEYLNTLYEMGVIQNFDCTESGGELYYEPDLALTRAEFAKILVLYTGTNAFPYVNEGAALEANTPYDKVPYIRAALASGLMSGRGTTDDGTVIFDPNATITREEAFKVIGTLLDGNAAELTFTDSSAISDWARDGIAKCVGAGIVSGYADGTLLPSATITRSELAAVLVKLS